MNMIERVARAMALKCGGGIRLAPGKSDHLDHFSKMARAAIEAMREPTEEMSLAGWKALEGNPVSPPLQCWDHMLDAALKDGEGNINPKTFQI